MKYIQGTYKSMHVLLNVYSKVALMTALQNLRYEMVLNASNKCVRYTPVEPQDDYLSA